MRLTAVHAQQLTGDADRWLDALNAAADRWQINTPPRLAMWLAQCAHESGGFKYLTESLRYTAARLRAVWPTRFTAEDAAVMAGDEQRIAERAYGGRLGNGREGSGDGYRYRGRGIIQLTGRANYRDAGAALGIDLVGTPEAAADPATAALIAGWFWATRGCNELADAGDFVGITKRINGGLNGLADRKAWLTKVREILGVTVAPRTAPDEPKTQPKEERMGGILGSLLPMVLGMFSGRAQAAIGRATGADPQVAAQFTQDLFAKLGQLVNVPVTDDATAVQAVAQAQTRKAAGDDQVARDLETHALDYLDKIAPLIDKLATHEIAVRKAADDSADRAAARGQKDARDIAPLLAVAGIAIFAVALLMVGGSLVLQLMKDADHQVDPLLASLLTILIYAAARIAESAYRYRFGGSADSAVVDSGNVAVRAAVEQRTGGRS